MKLLLPLASLFFAQAAFANAPKVVATCVAKVSDMEPTPKIRTYSITISEIGGKFQAATSLDGKPFSTDPVKYYSQEVRLGLKSQPPSGPADANEAEGYIVHAMNLAESGATTPGIGDVGLNLRRIRSAQVYEIGAATNMGASAIIVGKDERGQPLGSFFGGFFATKCR